MRRDAPVGGEVLADRAATTLTKCSWTWPSVESSRSSDVCRRSAGAQNSHGAGGVSESHTARSTVSGSLRCAEGRMWSSPATRQ